MHLGTYCINILVNVWQKTLSKAQLTLGLGALTKVTSLGHITSAHPMLNISKLTKRAKTGFLQLPLTSQDILNIWRGRGGGWWPYYSPSILDPSFKGSLYTTYTTIPIIKITTATVRFVLLLGAATKPALPDNLLVHTHLLLPQVISYQEDCPQYINLENIVRNI